VSAPVARPLQGKAPAPSAPRLAAARAPASAGKPETAAPARPAARAQEDDWESF